MPCLHRQDVLFSDSQDSKNQPSSSTKRPVHEAALQASEVVGGRSNKFRKVDNRPLCSFCSKPGHNAEACWVKYLDKKKSFLSRGKTLSKLALPLNNITVDSLQAMISKAVDTVLAPANKST